MNLNIIDLGIVVLYLVATIFIGNWVSKRASKNIQSYFLGGNSLPMVFPGDIKCLRHVRYCRNHAPCLLAGRLRAEEHLDAMDVAGLQPDIPDGLSLGLAAPFQRHDRGRVDQDTFRRRQGSNSLSYNSGRLCPGKRDRVSLLRLQGDRQVCCCIPSPLVSNPEYLLAHPQINVNLYALILMAITTFYVVKGGMFSVVITEVIQYVILTIASIAVGIIAIRQISPEALNAVIPEGWKSLWFGAHDGARLEQYLRCRLTQAAFVQ